MARAVIFEVLSRARSLIRARDGVAALEFALVVPLFAAIVILLADVAAIAAGLGTMQTAIRSAVQYAMNGGTDMAVARNQGLEAWDDRPASATLSAVQECLCGSSASACGELCPDQTLPERFVVVSASATFQGHVISRSASLTQRVRLR